MRFLHTSDWHLGRSLHKADLREAQAAFLDHLVETARSERVDAVLVAGDVYDRAIPPVDSVALYEDALARLRAAGARVILISGNHDSARRLGVNSALIDASGVHLRTRPAALADPVLLADEHGQVAVYGVPYLEPALALPKCTTGSCRRHKRKRPAGTATRRCSARRSRAIRADAAARAAAGRSRPDRRDGARLGGRGSVGGGAAAGRGADRQRVRAGHLGRRHRLRAREPVRPGSATSRSATCTGGRSWRSTCGTPAPRCPTRSRRRTTGRAAGSSRSAPAARPARSGCRRRSTGGSPCSRAASRTCSPRASTTGGRTTSSR